MQNHLHKQESQAYEPDQSSSSMSGYDLKGMLTRAQNQGYEQNDNYGVMPQNQLTASQPQS